MKTLSLAVVCSLSFLLGCATENIYVRHDIAISSDSERIAYNVHGAGKTTLIFVHGWSCDSRYWQKQFSDFSQEYQVIAIDLAGHGNSSLDRLESTMLSFAEDIKAVIEKEKIDKAILIGHSMGGGVIAEAAQLMPEKVSAIIGIDTLHNVAEKVPQKELDEMVNPFEVDFKNAAKSFISSMLTEGTDKKLIDWLKEDISSAPKRVAINAFRNYIGQYVNGEAVKVFKKIAVPAVSICAKLWPSNPDENRKHIQSYKIYYIEETGHFPMLEKPAKFNALLKEAIKYIENSNTK